MYHPEIVLMVGLPGSGKSTLVKEWENLDPQSVVLSTDDYIENIARMRNQTYSDVFNDTIQDANKWFNRELENAFKHDYLILVDRTSLTQKSRNRLLTMAPKYYWKTACIVYCDKIVRQRRIDQRHGKYIPVDVLRSMEAAYEYPLYSEGFNEIHYYENSKDFDHDRFVTQWKKYRGL